MTENEATIKWCPMSRFSNFGNDGVSNRDFFKAQNNIESCIASACMMWRRDGLYSNTPVSGRLVESGKSDSDGYCGLAGKE